MQPVDEDFGKLNPEAPAELSRFAFLIGRWKFAARFKPDGGEWQTYQGAWLGRCILDGYVIADEYRMTDAGGKLIVLGTNFRSFDAAHKKWNLRWLNALDGTWIDLASPELGGAKFDGQSVQYVFKDPAAAHAYTRATYMNISPTHFRWRGESSDDMNAWKEFMVVECDRQ